MNSATVLPSGALRRDREFALFDERGAFVNGKRDARVHGLRVVYDDGLTMANVTSALSGETFAFAFDDETTRLERWLERHFERRIFVRRNAVGGFPDDTEASGPTVISTATLEAVAAWFPDLGVASARNRFRANIEIDGVPAFWEDRLYGSAGETVPFRIGEVRIEGNNPCARCVVPSRNENTGAVTHAFAKILAQRRAAALPDWTNRARFDHYYRLAVNTRIGPAEAGKILSLASAVKLDVRPGTSLLRA